MTRMSGFLGSGRTVLVAGGAGFVGSHLCDWLVRAGQHVICLDSFHTGSRANVAGLAGSDRFAMVEHDVCEALPPDIIVDAVCNLACVASPPRYQADPVHTMMTSVLGTRNLLDLAARCGARFVQASTSEIYGDPAEHPQTESYWGNVNPTGPRACYDEGKRAAETLCFDYRRLGRCDVRVARIFNTYGPRMRADDGRIVSNLICQALSGEPLTIYGTGEQTRSFCYVTDLVRGLLALLAAEPAPEGPINLGNPGEFTVNELARMVLERTGSESAIVRLPLPKDDPQRRRPDISAAATLLGWRPAVPLREGLDLAIAWFAAARLPPASACTAPVPGAASRGRREGEEAAVAAPAGAGA
jgi:UDP-glucuronate decarboxylase